MAQAHTDLVNRTILEVSMIPGVRVWPNQTGVAQAIGNEKRFITFGLKGSSDIIGIMKCTSGAGCFLAIECKTGSDVIKKHQQYFREMITKHGGLYIEARSTNIVGVIQSFMLNN